MYDSHEYPQQSPVTQPPAGRRSRRVRAVAAVGGTALAAGLGLGGLAIASAQDDAGSSTGPTTSQVQPGDQAGNQGQGRGQGRGGDQGQGRGGEGRGHGGMRGGMQASELATALGVDEAKVTQAMQEIHDEMEAANGGARPSTPPTEADRDARRDEMATKLAEKLGVDKAKVTEALDAARARHEQERTQQLTTRLDEAVAAGTLTEADKASVLKAAQAGVLGGPGSR